MLTWSSTLVCALQVASLLPVHPKFVTDQQALFGPIACTKDVHRPVTAWKLSCLCQSDCLYMPTNCLLELAQCALHGIAVAIAVSFMWSAPGLFCCVMSVVWSWTVELPAAISSHSVVCCQHGLFCC
jgi:hypothetical protein